MIKLRVLLLALTFAVLAVFGLFLSFYARGYRFNFKKLIFEPNGILVVKTDPTDAEIIVNQNYKKNSDSSLSLSPGTYDLTIKKEGYLSWNKRIVIEKEIVTEISASLFKQAPSLEPLTVNGAQNPIESLDNTKIAYFTPASNDIDSQKSGLWIIENVNLPIGFTKEPRRLTDANLASSNLSFSPDGTEILAQTNQGIYLFDSNTYTPQNRMVNIESKYNQTLQKWSEEYDKKVQSNLRLLPEELKLLFIENTKYIDFSPDETKFTYIASSSAQIPEGLIKALPGASTQTQSRNIEEGKVYLYDIKEDRNFKILDSSESLALGVYKDNGSNKKLSWFPNSENLILAQDGSVSLMDYDGTNQQQVYSGKYTTPHVFPFTSTSKLIILTDLGSGKAQNLYSLTIK